MVESHVEDLLNHPKILETQDHLHHGIAKYDHLVRVTRYSYILAKLTRSDVRVCMRAGLIHDIDSRYGNLSNHGEVAARWAAE
ncbi:MAG TPA: phosphohydrolase, partial [Herpetosiphonaceae bacterium]|nr:phosphohydrolase [Herpetosiphonaceae bacterium]